MSPEIKHVSWEQFLVYSDNGSVNESKADWPSLRPPLRRAAAHSVGMPMPLLAGVCSGLAVHLGLRVGAVRAGFVILAFLGFAFTVFLYVWLWVTIPVDGTLEAQIRDQAHRSAVLARGNLPIQGEPPRTAENKDRIRSGWQLGAAGVGVIALALAIVMVRWQFSISWTLIFSICLILGGLILTWSQAPKASQVNDWRVLGLICAGTLVMVLGVSELISQDLPRDISNLGLGVGILVAILVLAALLPIWVRVNAALNASREQEAREAERADIAAHLHDSVLQTLTLIRSSANDPKRVSSLALSQERELRSWLYTSKKEPAISVSQQLRETIEAIEATYGIEISLVTVGDKVPDVAELAAVAAAGEATTNAVKHGKPPFSVYQEITVGALDIFVKDAGDGFDPRQIPEDRHGIRDSIEGRVRRVGGSVRIRTRQATEPQARIGQGTEIHIHLPLTAPGEAKD